VFHGATYYFGISMISKITWCCRC